MSHGNPVAPDLPIVPESIASLAWGLSFYFSSNDQERKFGEDLKVKWDSLMLRNQTVSEIAKFLESVNAMIASTVYSLSQMRSQLKDKYQFLDNLRDQQLKDLNDLASLTKDAESIATRLAGLAMGSGLTFIQFASSVLGPTLIVYTVVGAGSAYFILEALFRWYRSRRAPQILKQIQQRKEEALKHEFELPAREQIRELLTKVNQIAREVFKIDIIGEDRLIETADALSGTQARAFAVGGSQPVFPSISVYGTITDPKGNPVRGGTISFEGSAVDPYLPDHPSTGRLVMEGGLLRPDGKYSLGVEPGVYTVRVKPLGGPLQTISQNEEIVQTKRIDGRANLS